VDVLSFWKHILTPWVQARVARTERGASLVEYALLVALIAVVCIVAISFVGGEARDKFSEVGSKLN
jgi:pilus assembly protein Flp/PilA